MLCGDSLRLFWVKFPGGKGAARKGRRWGIEGSRPRIGVRSRLDRSPWSDGLLSVAGYLLELSDIVSVRLLGLIFFLDELPAIPGKAEDCGKCYS